MKGLEMVFFISVWGDGMVSVGREENEREMCG